MLTTGSEHKSEGRGRPTETVAMRELPFCFFFLATDFRVLLIYLCFLTQMLLSDCPKGCDCKWKSGKEAVICQNAPLTALPLELEPGTQVLDLSGSNITILHHDAFSKAGLLNLQKLYISKGRLRSLERYAFRDLKNLVELDISYNVLSSVPSHIFDSISELRELKLSGNPISRIPNNAFIHVPHLIKLELSSCKIKTIEPKAFHGLENSLEQLKLDNNKLSEVKSSSITVLENLYSLELSGNPWNCSCALRPLREWMQKRNMPFEIQPVCRHPSRLNSKSWDRLDLDEFACAPEILAVDTVAYGMEGRNITMTCSIDGIPEPTVQWITKNKVIANLSGSSSANGKKLFLVNLANKSSNLTILTADMQDAGVYVCAAENKAGRAQASVTLAVSRRPPQSPLTGKVLIASVVTGGLLVVLACLIVTCVYSVRRKRSLKWRKRKCRGEENYEKIELNHKVPGSSSTVTVQQQEVDARRNGDYRLIPGTDNEQAEKDKGGNSQSNAAPVATANSNGGQVTNSSWSTNGSKMLTEGKWESVELSLRESEDVNDARTKAGNDRDDCPTICNSTSGIYNYFEHQQLGYLRPSGLRSQSQFMRKQLFDGLTLHSSANHVELAVLNGGSEFEVRNCIPPKDRDDPRSYPDLIEGSSSVAVRSNLEEAHSGSVSSSSTSDVYCTLPRKISAFYRRKYSCPATESQSPLLPESHLGSSRESGDGSSLVGESYTARRFSDPYKNPIRGLSRESLKSSSYMNLININENASSVALPDVSYLESRVIYGQLGVPPNPSAVAIYDYHANQLEKFLEEYRSLQKELTKMKETCESIGKDDASLSGSVADINSKRSLDKPGTPNSSNEGDYNSCLPMYLSNVRDCGDDQMEVRNGQDTSPSRVRSDCF